jgi:hypothetical protein
MENVAMIKSVEAENVCTGKYKPHAKPQFHKISKEGSKKHRARAMQPHSPSNHYQQIFPNQKSFFLPTPCFDDNAHV